MIHPDCSVTPQINQITSQIKDTCSQDELEGRKNKIINLNKIRIEIKRQMYNVVADIFLQAIRECESIAL